MLPDIHRATQKFYIFLIVYLTGCTPVFYEKSLLKIIDFDSVVKNTKSQNQLF